MQTLGTTGAAGAKRADARKNIAAIIEAATASLARDPNVSVNDIAKAAGVGRVTLYGHFDSRAALIREVVDRAIHDTDAELNGLDLEGDPRDALARLLEATWRLTHRYGSLIVAAEAALAPEDIHDAHVQPMTRMRGLIERGQASGAFRSDLPIAWLVEVAHSTVHGAADALHRGDITEAQAPTLITETVLAVLTPSH
ncbi:TetR/AcrR family transcriptional regulator [Agromyces sp. SYSU K20354]|uniref:TetR/AcrR family transcriptional regulator n=1 Tax=Agromyces cavernae TaxID=2898659 RepID=UPI001E4EB8E4|nr:TetR/AcrR family transcriptional regulator [Agromyces cavernae]MCD2441536.1 TetR/AcrR family transcriptional regulator [Agromyces cavernae]